MWLTCCSKLFIVHGSESELCRRLILSI
jgi:hypothetical protein